jgi:hypothetical protein
VLIGDSEQVQQGEHQFRGEGALRIALLIIIMREEHD